LLIPRSGEFCLEFYGHGIEAKRYRAYFADFRKKAQSIDRAYS